MLNFKQKELSENLFLTLKAQFPDIGLVEIIENPFEGGEVWMRIQPPVNSQQQSQFSELAAELSTNILVEYGYDIAISYVTDNKAVH
ncbi:MAG: hypothetical protein RL368_2045 [Pseudomonadota bacterium]|jgi:hypothetical protein